MAAPGDKPHIPVLIGPLLRLLGPVRGIWVDGTFGAGGYARALLAAGADKVIGIDRDPQVFDMAADWAGEHGARLVLAQGNFGDLDHIATRHAGGPVAGVVLDVGVSSMQLDQAERGFSFARSGPLDMRMSQSGTSAADIVNRADEVDLSTILFRYGEERASRRIARAIVARRALAPFETTADLAEVVSRCLPRPRPGQPHPATRSFQALRIAVNDELGQLAQGLAAAERLLPPGGLLAVVTFHSLEDRIVKRFFALGSGEGPGGSRHAPVQAEIVPRWERLTRKPVEADPDELDANPRARSARLRVGRRLDAPSSPPATTDLGVPEVAV